MNHHQTLKFYKKLTRILEHKLNKERDISFNLQREINKFEDFDIAVDERVNVRVKH